MKELIKKLYRWFLKKEIYDRKLKRKEVLRDYIYLKAPNTYPLFKNQVVIENCTLNIFSVRENQFPYFDIYIPELGIFILLEDPSWSSQNIADVWGVSTEEWNQSQLDRQAYLDYFLPLSSSKRFISIPWSDYPEDSLKTLLKKVQ